MEKMENEMETLGAHTPSLGTKDRVFPKLEVPFLGVPIIRIVVCWGLDWGPPILGNFVN